jgi:hypothetical protein
MPARRKFGSSSSRLSSVGRGDIVRVEEQTKRYGADGSVTLKTKLSCGCLIYQSADLFGGTREPIWIRCARHRHTRPEDIIVQRL